MGTGASKEGAHRDKGQQPAGRTSGYVKLLTEEAQENERGTSSNGTEDFTVSEALDVIGIGPYQYRLIFLASCFSLATGLARTSFVLFPSLARCYLEMTSVQEAVMQSVGYLGVGFGGVAMGLISTMFGRRFTLIFVSAWIGYFGLLSSIARGYGWLLLLRFLLGFGRSGSIQRYLILIENMPAKHRTVVLTVTSLSFYTGNFLETIIVKFVLPTGAHVAWRYILLIDALFFILCFVFSKWAFESPFWLLNVRGDRAKALKALQIAAKMNGKALPRGNLVSEEERANKASTVSDPLSPEKDDSSGNNAVQSSSPASLQRRKSQLGKGTILDLFRPWRMLRTSICMMVISLGISLAVVSFGIITEEILQQRKTTGAKCVDSFDVYHKHDQESTLSCDHLSSHDYLPVVIIYASEYPSLLLMHFMATVLGRCLAMAVSIFLVAVCYRVLIICPLSLVSVVAVLSCYRMLIMTAFSINQLYSAEAYPTYVRSYGAALSISTFAVGAMFSPFLAQVLFRQSVLLSKAIHAGILGVTALACLFLPIETNNRKLEEG